MAKPTMNTGRHRLERWGWHAAQRRPGDNRGPGYAKYIGRIGALAVALGIGVAVGTNPGLALAGPQAPSSPSPDGTVQDPPKPKDTKPPLNSPGTPAIDTTAGKDPATLPTNTAPPTATVSIYR